MLNTISVFIKALSFNSVQNKLKPMIYLIATLFSLSLVMESLSWNISPVDDGVIYPQSFVVSEGGILFKDVQAQYGSFVHYFQAVFMKIFTQSLLFNRIIGLIPLFGSAFCLYLLIRNSTSRRHSFIIAITFVLTIPQWTVFSEFGWPRGGLVWPNYYATFLALISITHIFYISKKQNPTKKDLILAFFNGINIWNISTVRIDFFFTTLAIMTWLLVFGNYLKKVRLFIAIGVVANIFTQLMYLTYNDALNPFFDQIIVELLRGSYNDRLVTFGPLLKYLLVFLGILAIFLSVTFVFNRSFKQKNLITSTIFYVILLVILNIGSVWTTNIALPRTKFFSYLYLVTQSPLMVYCQFLLVLTLAHGLYLIFKSRNDLKNIFKTSDKGKRMNVLFLLTSFSTFPSLIHNLSITYIHMVVPFFILYISQNISLRRFFTDKYRSMVISFLYATIFVSVSMFILANSQAKYVFEQGNFKGMKMSNERDFHNYSRIQRIISVFSVDHKIAIKCGAGVFSINNDKYVVNSIYPMPGLNSETLLSIENDLNSSTIVFDCFNRDELDVFLRDKNHLILEIGPYSGNQTAVFYKYPKAPTSNR